MTDGYIEDYDGSIEPKPMDTTYSTMDPLVMVQSLCMSTNSVKIRKNLLCLA